MQIALFTECYHPIVNGVVISVSTFARELRKLGHEVRIYAPAYPGHRDSDPHVHRLPSLPLPTRPRYPLALPFGLQRVMPALRARPPEIVHAQHLFGTGRQARHLARRLRIPLIVTYHTIIRAYAHYVPLPRPLVRWAAVRVSRQFSNSADCVIVPTRAVGHLLRSYGVCRPIAVVPTGIALDLIDGTPRRPALEEFGIPPGAPVVAYAGRVAREKSLDLLLHAFTRAASRIPDAHLLLVGGGPWYLPCRRLAESLGLGERVHFTGYLPRTRVFDCLAESQVFAFPSLTDTQGVAVLEAMALGCPPIAVRSGAVEDVIRDGVDGMLVEPDSEALAEGIICLLDSQQRRRDLAVCARARAEAFSASRMAERLVQVYQQLAGGAGPQAGC